jgi:hypothetical protein
VARWGFAAALAAGTAEVAVRAIDPAPRTQVVRPDAQRRLRDVRGVPAWERLGDGWPETLRGEGCVVGPGGKRVVFTGDSILQVTGEAAVDNFVVDLRARLPGWCLHNVAEAGFIGEQKAAVALDALERGGVDAVVWEVWGERGHAVRHGEVVMHVGGYDVDDAGWPVVPWLPVPSALHDALMARSRAWAYAVLAIGPTGRFAPVSPLFEGVRAATVAQGGRMALLVMPELERPFGEPSPVWDEVKAEVAGWAASSAVPSLDIGAAWAGKYDHEALRLDPCCHYNPAGHDALADTLAAWLPTVVGDEGAIVAPR